MFLKLLSMFLTTNTLTLGNIFLSEKKYHYEVRGIVNDWFSSYLDGRSQVTQISEYTSEKVITIPVVFLKDLFLALTYSWSI